MDYTFDTLRPEREHACPACRYQRAGELSPMGDSPPAHNCRTKPATPRTTLAEQARVANAILYESGLSFLGLGAQPPQPSWGTMLSSAKSYMFDDPWYTAIVGVTLSATIIALNLVGDAIRETIDPLLSRRG